MDDRAFTTAEIVAVSGVPEKSITNWTGRKLLAVGERHFTGRRLFSVEDAIRLAAMHDLTVRVPIGPTDVAQAAEVIVRQVIKHAPRDAAGHPLFTLDAVPATVALALAVEDGLTCVGLIDPTQPGYAVWPGPWARAHVVVPIAAMLMDVSYRLIELTDRREPELGFR